MFCKRGGGETEKKGIIATVFNTIQLSLKGVKENFARGGSHSPGETAPPC